MDEVRRIPVSASGEYDVLIGRGLISSAGVLVREVLQKDFLGDARPAGMMPADAGTGGADGTNAERCGMEFDENPGSESPGNQNDFFAAALIVSDENVFHHWGEIVVNSFKGAGFRVWKHVVKPGEQSKSPAVYIDLLEHLASRALTASDVVIGLGGGVVGDLAGFAAATYRRGIPYVQIPTSLLGMVDSSVGGKTGINLHIRGAGWQDEEAAAEPDNGMEGKNLAGCIYQPKLVICDPDVLSTLPDSEVLCGTGEIIKYGMLGSVELLKKLRGKPMIVRVKEAGENQPANELEDIIAECVNMKAEIIASDEFDRGRRRLLNFGHTAGHGIEACSGFSVSHGEAVGMGMALITAGAVGKKMCSESVLTDLMEILEKNGLPVAGAYSPELLADAVKNDKKRQGRTINLVIPMDVGRCEICAVPVESVREWFSHGLAVLLDRTGRINV